MTDLPKQQTLADVKYTDANAKRRRRYTVRSFGFSCSSGFLLDKMTGKSLDMRFALVPKLPFLPHQPASREEVWDYLKSTTEKNTSCDSLNVRSTGAQRDRRNRHGAGAHPTRQPKAEAAK